jgi:hypothetical protein
VSNIPKDGLHWDLHSAAREFSTSVDTIRKRLVAIKESPDESKCYSTGQLVHAIFGSLQAARLKEVEERGTNLQLKNQALRSELLDRSLLMQALGNVFVSINHIISSSALPRQARTDILEAIASVPVLVRGVAERQNRQLRIQEPEEEEEAKDVA